MIHDGKERRARGGGAMMKGIWIHPESMCCFLCSLQSNKNGHGKRDVPLFFFFVRVFRINFPFIVLLKLETWKHCSSGRCAHNPLIQSQTRSWTALQTHIWLFVRGQIQNTKLIILPWECFSFYYFFNFKQSLKIKKCSYLNSVWK